MLYIWLAAMGGFWFFDNSTAMLITWMVGIGYFFLWLLMGGPKVFQIKPGTWVTDVRQENGQTKITLSNGEISWFSSKKIQIENDKIYVY